MGVIKRTIVYGSYFLNTEILKMGHSSRYRLTQIRLQKCLKVLHHTPRKILPVV